MSSRELPIVHLAAIGVLYLLVIVSLIARAAFAQEARLAVANDQSDQAIPNFHGAEYLARNSEFFASGRFLVDATITDATADARGNVTIEFRVEDREGESIAGLTDIAFNIAKLMPASNGQAFNRWVPYIYRLQTVSGSTEGDWPSPDGTEAWQGYREPAEAGDLTDHGDGRYSYEFATDLSEAVAGPRAVEYDRRLTHRVAVMLAVDGGATGDGYYDFVPDGSAITETRDIIQTATCQSCHGSNEFHGHDGERHQVQTCATCHTADLIDPHSGESLDLKVLIHRIHAGSELATISGTDGIVFDDPATATDEAADNGSFVVWGDGNEAHTWWNIEFPAVIENCTKCHQGGEANVDNWKNVPSRAACGSCHNSVDFAAGINHEVAVNDNECVDCHKPAGDPDAVADSHDWLHHDPRNIPEFDVDLRVATPTNGTHFLAGEAPVITITLREDGELIDHTSIVADTDGNEGCEISGCPPSDGKFAHAYLFVHGPRARRVPVLTTAARAKVVATSVGPFDLSAKDAALSLEIDGGKDVMSRFSTKPGSFSVAVVDGEWNDVTAATPDEIIEWLSGDAAFDARAIAYLEGDRLAIRSRNLGDFFSIALGSGPVTDEVFGGNMSVHEIGGTIVFNDVVQFPDGTNNDPKAGWSRDTITYTLDPVDDLEPGTYVASVQISGQGRGPTEDNYRTPSVAKTLFQVGTPEEELPPAGNCGSCHQGPDGTGFVLDFMRHYKIFDNTAVDQCGACHDYQSIDDAGSWDGARAIARRVHAVHFGASLNYPLATVDYRVPPMDAIPGRNWNITFPQDIRGCETCHPADTTSGSWMTEASRLPCSGCHDSQEAQAHMKLQTYDPTPAHPWNGDEEESCKVCH
jgi:hypothetical protein